MLPNFQLLLVGLASTISASPVAAQKPPAFLLAGDSTTAVQSTGGGGWGNGFLSTLRNGAGGINYGHNGATTVSFVGLGDWANVLASVQKYKPKFTPCVTIQFGHNDQKAEKGISINEFKQNLKKMAEDVKNAGGTPILVTSISRRTFTSAGVVKEDLGPQANATIEVAKSIGAFYIDLNRASTDYLNAIGAKNAATYNLAPKDFTHLNAAGSVLFGNMVGGLISTAVGSSLGFPMSNYISLNRTIAMDIGTGTYILPSGFGTLPSNTLPK
ncbi:hypothetical protein DSL72_006220 [Monilinia vaccinii-corymbosi]|uniref:SGNH hydrolase-type esterase domain-containing protein n=1 Tax=Monilinia vaccinii-corymbosi TaxID=61207 RepID=A0A8A3PN49_9HELO|nr:hypothetical protein DSL72_006220 [Monilinia vaccinii-corymbosi]